MISLLISRYGLDDKTDAQPSLSIYSSATNIGISWPIWAHIFTLESARKSLPLDWEPVGDETTVVGDRVTLRLALSEQLRFYRLRKP